MRAPETEMRGTQNLETNYAFFALDPYILKEDVQNIKSSVRHRSLPTRAKNDSTCSRIRYDFKLN